VGKEAREDGGGGEDLVKRAEVSGSNLLTGKASNMTVALHPHPSIENAKKKKEQKELDIFFERCNHTRRLKMLCKPRAKEEKRKELDCSAGAPSVD
jgi:hypothetical protein